MTAREIEFCSNLEDLFQRLRASYKRCILPNQPFELPPWAIVSPDTTNNGRGVFLGENDDSNRDTLLQEDLSEASQICFAGECLIVKAGPPESVESESERTMITVLVKLLARENDKRPFS